MVRKRTFKADVVAVPAAWKTVANQRKTIAIWPEWTDPPALPGRRVGEDKDDVHTVAAETIELLVPLADEAGVGLEGVNLRVTAWPFKKQYDVTATLEVPGNRSFVTIARVVHRFEDNAKLGRDAFGAGNLPLAAPVNGRLQSYRDFLRVLSEEFKIDGLDQLAPPDWTVMI